MKDIIKLGAEFILSAIAIPVIVTAFLWITDLQKASAVQESKLQQLIHMTEEIRIDVKELIKGEKK